MDKIIYMWIQKNVIINVRKTPPPPPLNEKFKIKMH
jgi:hypothetical protein